MDEYPGVVFRSGPAGRRPGLVAGPDIWEVASVHRSFDDVDRTASWLDQQAGAIETALRYYEAHKTDIDEWIKRNEEAAEAAECVVRARQAAGVVRDGMIFVDRGSYRETFTAIDEESLELAAGESPDKPQP